MLKKTLLATKNVFKISQYKQTTRNKIKALFSKLRSKKLTFAAHRTMQKKKSLVQQCLQKNTETKSQRALFVFVKSRKL